jgi:hypothetical protein
MMLLSDVARWSLFGLLEVWNELPAEVIETSSVGALKGKLQHLMDFRHHEGWAGAFCAL